jgi:hypothetical protein
MEDGKWGIATEPGDSRSLTVPGIVVRRRFGVSQAPEFSSIDLWRRCVMTVLMETGPVCGACGTPLSSGFCPRWLLDVGLSPEPDEVPDVENGINS